MDYCLLLFVCQFFTLRHGGAYDGITENFA